MAVELGPFLIKLAGVVATLAKEPVLKNEHVVRLLKKFGYERLKDEFDTLYVNALVLRRLDGTPAPLLTLFKEESVVEAFHGAWKEGRVEPFDETARWAIEAFREGDELRGTTVDVEKEVRSFFQTFSELTSKARSPGDQKIDRLIKAIHKAVTSQPTPEVPVLPSEGERFQRDLSEWLIACGYVQDVDPQPVGEDGAFDLHVSFPRPRGRKRDQFLVRGLPGIAGAGQVHDLPFPKQARTDESWLVSAVDVTAPARKKAKEAEGRFVFSFDDLIDERVRFDEYERYLEEEVKRRDLDRLFVPLGCRRPEVDQQGVVRGEERHEETTHYIDWWLEQPVHEQVSILGEFGTGKTWFTLRLASDRLQAYRAARKARKPRGRYPLLIQLRDYAKAVSVESLLSEFFFDRFEVGLPSMKAFRVLNRMRRFLLIFDGFDEMARKVDYQKVVDNFWELAKVVVPGAKAVLTCREEHFRHTQEAREVFAGHEMATTAKIVLVPPRFEVVHLEPFDEPRIRQAIVARQGKKEGSKTADLILSHKGLADLVKRPVMIDMVLQSLDDIKGRDSIVTSQVYLFATDTQMRKNIKEERTFTSMTEKVLFLCELAWEMHRTQNLRINYKLFPERLLEIFGDRVTETEKDHWWFDLMGQTLLVRDADGNYSFAHRGFVEYFAAYRLLAQVDALAPEFFDRYQDEGTSPAEALRERAQKELRVSWGEAPMHPNLVAFLAEMASGKDALLRLIDWTKGEGEDEVGYVGGNAATVLARIDAEALKGADLTGASLRQAKLPGARLRGTNAEGADLREADLMAADLTTANFRKAKLEGTRLAGLRTPAALACSESGDVLFAGPWAGGWVYDVPGRKFIDVYGHEGELVWTCNRAVSPDGSWLAYAYVAEIRVGQVDRETGLVRWEKTEKPQSHQVPGVAWHPGGSFLVIGPEGVFRVDRGLPISIHQLEPLPFVIESRAGIAIRPPWWVIGGHRSTTVWHEEEKCVVANLPPHAFDGERPEFSPTGARLSIANTNGLFIFDTASWTEVGHVEGNSTDCVHGWSPTGEQVAFCVRPEVLVVESADLSVSLRFSLPNRPRGVAFHGPNELVVLDDEGTVHLYNLKREKLIHSSPQVPLCEGADFRGATGLDEATSGALKLAGAKVDGKPKGRARTKKAVRKVR